MAKPPRRSQRPNYVSTASYWHEGRRQLRAALSEFPAMQTIDALVLHLGTGPVLAKATVLRYRENARRVVRVWARMHRENEAWVDIKMTEIYSALAHRKKPGRRKHGTKKIPKLATQDEFVAIARDLRQRYDATGNITPALTYFFIFAMRVAGVRPVELLGMTVDGGNLLIRNAKRQVGQDEFRTLSLADFPPQTPRIFDYFCAMIAADNLSRFEFDLFRDRLSESLARACARVNVPRLNLYSFRHLAIALWTESGLLAEIIAQLSGHFATKTAARNYAKSSGGGWSPNGRMIARPVVQNVDADMSASQNNVIGTAISADAEAPRVNAGPDTPDTSPTDRPSRPPYKYAWHKPGPMIRTPQAARHSESNYSRPFNEDELITLIEELDAASVASIENAVAPPPSASSQFSDDLISEYRAKMETRVGAIDPEKLAAGLRKISDQRQRVTQRPSIVPPPKPK